MDADSLSKADLWVSINRGNERVRRLSEQFARAVEQAMARAIEDAKRRGKVNEDGTVPITPFMQIQIMKDIDKALNAMYGSAPGSPNPLETIIVEESRRARLLGITRVAEQTQRELGPIMTSVMTKEIEKLDQELNNGYEKRWAGNG